MSAISFSQWNSTKNSLTSIDAKPYPKFYGSEGVDLGGELGKTFQGQSDLVRGGLLIRC